MSPITIEVMAAGYSYSQAMLTLEFHFLLMFLPGFVTGRAIERVGPLPVAGAGLACAACSGGVLLSGLSLWHFVVGRIYTVVLWGPPDVGYE